MTVRNSGHNGTRLFDALDQAAADIPPDQLAGAVMLTDGQVSDTPDSVPERLTPVNQTGAKAHLPLHVLIPAKGGNGPATAYSSSPALRDCRPTR